MLNLTFKPKLNGLVILLTYILCIYLSAHETIPEVNYCITTSVQSYTNVEVAIAIKLKANPYSRPRTHTPDNP